MIDVWTICSGEYSSYTVHVMAFSEEKAEQLAEHMNEVERKNFADYYVDGPLQVIEGHEPLPWPITTWYARGVGEHSRVAYEQTRWPFQRSSHEDEPCVVRTGNAKHREFHAYGYPTKEAALAAIEEAIAADQEEDDPPAPTGIPIQPFEYIPRGKTTIPLTYTTSKLTFEEKEPE